MRDRSAPINILLVEDDASDVLLTTRAFKRATLPNSLSVARDGMEALSLLSGEGNPAGALRPDLILLDLNMPRIDGRELLKNLKTDAEFKQIPIIVLTTSDSESDVRHCYEWHANCYITKPVSVKQFDEVVSAISEFWCTIAKLPPK